MRCPARSPPFQPPLGQLLDSSSLNLSLGLRTIARNDPMPKPAKKNVIAEFKSYSFLIRRNLFPALLRN
jgi:hypothetical protein